ncbi:hypothetical protein [Pseudoduganella sp. HUAS MS19]
MIMFFLLGKQGPACLVGGIGETVCCVGFGWVRLAAAHALRHAGQVDGVAALVRDWRFHEATITPAFHF